MATILIAGMVRFKSNLTRINGTPATIMTEEQEVFLAHIQKQGLKRTAQRDLILSVFLRTEEHLSSEDLYLLVHKEDPSVGQTTVYRTLKLLAEAGLAREVRFGDGMRDRQSAEIHVLYS